MENFDRKNIDELLEIRQICQYFPRKKFAPYGKTLKSSHYPFNLESPEVKTEVPI